MAPGKKCMMRIDVNQTKKDLPEETYEKLI